MKKTVDHIMERLDFNELENVERYLGYDWQETLKHYRSRVESEIKSKASFDDLDDEQSFYIDEKDYNEIIKNLQSEIDQLAIDMRYNYVQFHDGTTDVVREGYKAIWYDCGEQAPEFEGFPWELYFDKDKEFSGVFIGSLTEKQRKYVENFFSSDFTDLDLNDYDVVEKL